MVHVLYYSLYYSTLHTQLSIQESAILAKMADQYRMPHLAKGCTAVLDTKFASLAKAGEPDPKLLDWMLFADRYRIQSLIAWCEHLVIKHFPTVAQVRSVWYIHRKHMATQDPRLLQLSGHCWQVRGEDHFALSQHHSSHSRSELQRASAMQR